MDKRSKYLILGFCLVFLLVAVKGYQTFFIEKDFMVLATTECDPTEEACFMWCEEECEDDYYKKIAKKGYSIPACDPLGECEPLVCGENEPSCVVTLCSEEAVEEGEICTNPADFQTGGGDEDGASSTDPVL